MADTIDTNIIDQATDWGTMVSEATAKKTPISRLLLLIAFTLLAVGSILLIPLLAGTMLFTSTGAALELLIVGTLLLLAFAFKKKSGDLPRNALQIDYEANELRLGAELPGGAFRREQVVSFRDIDEVNIDSESLCLHIPGEIVTLNFNGADQASLDELAIKISAARESALRAPVRSRIQSRMRGFEASFYEAKQRVRSRITRTV